MKCFIFKLLAVFLAFLMQSCVMFGVETLESGWRINNNSSHEVIACTVCVDDNGIISSDYVDPIVLIPHNYNKFCVMYSDMFLDKKLAQGKTRIYFMEIDNDTSAQMNLRNVGNVVTNADAYINLELKWMEIHGYNINYPEDCTIIKEVELGI